MWPPSTTKGAIMISNISGQVHIRHADLVEQLDEYRADAVRADAVRADALTGDNVQFTYGRGDTARQLLGSVVGLRGYAGSKRLRVMVGEGFHTVFFTIGPKAILGNPDAEGRALRPFTPVTLAA
jgi:hypothetical protein